MVRTRRYLDFDLLVEGDLEQGYKARVLRAPSGETPPVAVAPPFSSTDLERFFQRIGRRSATRHTRSDEDRAVQKFGADLFDAVFHGALHRALVQSRDQAEAQGCGLRLRLRLTDCPELAELPWEFLYDRENAAYLALSEWTPVVRYLHLQGSVKPLLVQPPLHVLVMVASPSTEDLLDVDDEWERLRESLGELVRDGKVVIDLLPGGRMSDLQKALRRGEYHVFHFIGHGAYDDREGDGYLIVEGADGRGVHVRGSELGELLHDHRTLRLCVLNSCEGARGGRDDPYGGTAQSLVRRGIPAVVAMQADITDRAAIVFSHGLYEAIADGYPLDAAMGDARKAVRHDQNSVEWGTPVLYLRSPDGQIFDVETTASPAVSPRDPVNTPEEPVVPERPSTQAPTSSALAVTRADDPPERNPAPDPAPAEVPVVAPAWTALHRWDVGQWVTAIAVSTNGRWIATGSRKRVRVWDVASGKVLWARDVCGFIMNVAAVAFSRDGRWLLVGCEDGVCTKLDTRTGVPAAAFALPQVGQVRAVTFSPRFALAAVAGTGRPVQVVSARSGKTIKAIESSGVASVAFTPEGDGLLAGRYDGTAVLWDVESGEERLALKHPLAPGGRSFAVGAVATAPDGGAWATATSVGVVRVWSTQGEERFRVEHGAAVTAVAFSPDSGWLAACGDDQAVRVWDATTGELRGEARHANQVKGVAFGPDGRWVASGSTDKTVRIWRLGDPR